MGVTVETIELVGFLGGDFFWDLSFSLDAEDLVANEDDKDGEIEDADLVVNDALDELNFGTVVADDIEVVGTGFLSETFARG